MRNIAASLLRHTLQRIRLFFILSILAFVPSCATDTYAGIDLRSGGASEDVQMLARRAQSGDKDAQLLLGKRYEFGEGLPVDLSQARKLYAAAATRSGGTIMVYSPPVGKNDQGRIIPVDAGPVREGLPEAQARLAKLKVRAKAD